MSGREGLPNEVVETQTERRNGASQRHGGQTFLPRKHAEEKQ